MNRHTDDPGRNRPAEKGTNNDPYVRDQTGQRPTASTISDSKNEQANERVTRTVSENHEVSESDKYADPSFDEDDVQE